jgi:hypothetical protein
MAKLSEILCDPTKLKGAWMDCPMGVRLLVARFWNPTHSRRLGEIYLPHTERISAGTMPYDELLALNKRAAAECLLVGWDGIVDDDGKSVTYTPDLGEQLFADDGPEGYYRGVIAFAQARESYLAAPLRAIEGNSSPASSGSSTTESRPTS